MIKLYNLKTKDYEIEKVAGEGAMNFLYSSNIIGNLGLELLVKRKIFSAIAGKYCDMNMSKSKISGFIKDYNINMDESLLNEGEFSNFNHFFTRKLRDEARNFNKEENLFLSPCDARMKVWENIDIDKVVQIKGMNYKLSELVPDNELTNLYQGGTCILLRLAPVDYHRFHFMDDGFCTQSTLINGDYYSVNPIALKAVANAFCRNKREYSVLNSQNFGKVLYVEVGATSVGAIVQTYDCKKEIKRGDEKGYFKFGGSTVILFVQKGYIEINKEITEQIDNDIEVRVFAGDVIGKKVK